MLLATNLELDEPADIYRGEVRDVYALGEKIISVSTDRISVFGHLFRDAIPHKGQVLNQLTEYFAAATKDIVPNWVESFPDPNVAIGKKCQPFKVNFVIRGALVGHAWRIYEAGSRTICGQKLEDDLQEYDLFEEPMITPSTKAQSGFEEDITAGEIIEHELMSEAVFERLSIIARQLFIHGKQMARNQGLILADTKYEFGLYNDEIYLIDEIHTPDCSRYFYADEYEAFLKDRSLDQPRHLSKECIRQWALQHGYSGLDNQIPPVMEENFVQEISKRYIEVYERLTGRSFVPPDPEADPIERIQENIKTALTNR